MKLIPVAILIVLASSCSSGKFLQPCQSDAAENLGKGMNIIGSKLPAAYLRVNKHLYDNAVMSKFTAISINTSYDSSFPVLDSISRLMAAEAAQFQLSLDSSRAGWILCLKITELLKAVANPDFAKAVINNKDGIAGNIDSLISKYNHFSGKKISADYGKLFASIALELGTRRIKKQQAKYFKKAFDSSAVILEDILFVLNNMRIPAFRSDLRTLESNYIFSYRDFNRIMKDKKMTFENAYKIALELESYQKEITQLKAFGEVLHTFNSTLRDLIRGLTASLNNNEKDCTQLNAIITRLDLQTNMLETYSSFIK